MCEIADALSDIANMPFDYGEPWLHDSQRDTLRKAADLLRSREWRKIEEAKRDGTHYWLYFPTAHPDNRQCVGWYVSRSDWEGFIDAADSEHDQPTHFQPLPQPPEGETPR